MKEGNYYKRNLPHYQPDNEKYFVTFRLANSLPKAVVENLRKENELLQNNINLITNEEKKKVSSYELRKKYFGKFDQLLDNSSKGSLWLKNEKIANIVSDSMKHRDGKQYLLYCYCIMPNHVHMVFGIGEDYVKTESVSDSPISESNYKVTKIMQGLKKFTAIESNKILKRSGQFWHRESFDHVIRGPKEFENIINYVLQNPVKAGLVNDYKEWKWSYLHPSLM